MSGGNVSDLWKPDREVRSAIARGERKVREAEQRRSEQISRERELSLAIRKARENVTNVPF